MYRNLEQLGVAAQKKLYGKYADQVIDAYVSAKTAGMSRELTLRAMERKISKFLGPSDKDPAFHVEIKQPQ